jgi:hypothetical protein
MDENILSESDILEIIDNAAKRIVLGMAANGVNLTREGIEYFTNTFGKRLGANYENEQRNSADALGGCSECGRLDGSHHSSCSHYVERR